MKKFIVILLALVFINSFFQLIPVFFKDLKKEIYIPYQAWFNLIAVLYVFLDKFKANYLYEMASGEKGSPDFLSKNMQIEDKKIKKKVDEEF